MVWLCRSQYRGREAEQRGRWQEEVTARHSARHCFLKWVPNPHGLFLPVFMGAFFLTLLRAGKEIKDIIIVKAYILSLVQNWQRSHPCGSGFESMWGGPPGFVP